MGLTPVREDGPQGRPPLLSVAAYVGPNLGGCCEKLDRYTPSSASLASEKLGRLELVRLVLLRPL